MRSETRPGTPRLGHRAFIRADLLLTRLGAGVGVCFAEPGAKTAVRQQSFGLYSRAALVFSEGAAGSHAEDRCKSVSNTCPGVPEAASLGVAEKDPKNTEILGKK